jgi:hypothetical protein
MMRRTIFGGGLAATFVLASAGSAMADPYYHDGFQFRGTIGPGYINDSATFSDGSPSATISGGGASIELYFGGAPVRGLGLTIGAFLAGSSAIGPSFSQGGMTVSTSNSVSFGVGTFGPYADYYPNPGSGFHVLGTLGFAQIQVSDDNSNTKVAENGFTLGAGAGYDFWIAGDWSLGVLARFTYVNAKGTSVGVTENDNVIAPALLFSVCFQ